MFNCFYISNLAISTQNAAHVKQNHGKSCETSKFTANAKIYGFHGFREFVIFIQSQLVASVEEERSHDDLSFRFRCRSICCLVISFEVWMNA